MADRVQSYKVICSGGLNSNENHLDLAENYPGVATRLVNYEVSDYGGYRRIEGYDEYDTTYGEVGVGVAEGKVLGVFLFKDSTTQQDMILAARKDQGANTFKFYKYVFGSGWVAQTTGITHHTTKNTLTVNKIRHAKFNFGSGNHIVFVDGVNFPVIFNGTTWYELQESNSGGTSSPGGVMSLDAPSVVEVFENHLFFGGDRTELSTVAFSAPNDPLTWTAAAGAGQTKVGFDLVNFKPFRDDLFLFGSNSIKKLTADVSSGFNLGQVTANVGCIAKDSILEIGGDLVFLAPDGLRPVAGTSRIGDVELETISKPIQLILSSLASDFDLDTLNGLVIRSKSQLRYFIGDDSTAVIDSFGIIGGLRTSDQRIGWEFGELLGIRASCCTSGYVGTTEIVLHGDYDGKIYKQENGKTFNGNDIVGIYTTPYFDFGDTEVRKTLRKVNTFIRAEGPFTMNLAVTYDWDDPNTAVPSSYSEESQGAPVRYKGTNINYAGTNINYGGNDKPIMVTNVQGSGFAAQVTYVTVGQFDPYSIQGIVFEFTAAGRK